CGLDAPAAGHAHPLQRLHAHAVAERELGHEVRVVRRADRQPPPLALDDEALDEVVVALDPEVALAADLDDERAGRAEGDAADAGGRLGAGAAGAGALDGLAHEVYGGA